jgi:hypothetical protein
MSEDLSKTGDLSSISDEFLKEITTATFNSLNDLYKQDGTDRRETSLGKDLNSKN